SPQHAPHTSQHSAPPDKSDGAERRGIRQQHPATGYAPSAEPEEALQPIRARLAELEEQNATLPAEAAARR
ncbi:hypothetical protein ABT001_29405, partial [Streptomyces sp. NPDC002793]